ncbi:hypothetical protein CF326_g7235 [Tilletia indica]|nr:hypothetical protein CF326_g7235 [Tilletia indica]
MLRALLEGTQRASVHFAPGQHSPLILTVGGISLLTGHQVEWVIEEFGIHIAEVIARLKEDNHNTELDMWAKMGWSRENGYGLKLRAISDPDEKEINVFDVRGRQRLTTVGAKLSFLLRLFNAVQEGRPQPFPEQNFRTFGVANPLSQNQEQLLQISMGRAGLAFVQR